MTKPTWPGARCWWFRSTALFCLAVSAALTGCGGQSLAPVTGKVLYKGKEVPGGQLVFSPVGSGNAANAGRPALAGVQADGSFTLETNGVEGAPIGRHQVTFTPPPLKLTKEQQESHEAPPPAPSPYAGLVPKEAEVEVKAGTNIIEIELVPVAKKTHQG